VSVGLSFALFYALFVLCFVTQSLEFNSAGISAEAILEAVGWLTPSQDLSFCQYQLRRTSGVLAVHTCLPLVFFVVNYLLQFTDVNDLRTAEVPAVYYNLALVPSVLLPVGALTLIYYWKKMTNWTRHPIAKRLAAYTSTTNPTWVHVLREVNMDCLRLDKLVIANTPVSKVIVTSNWILRVGQWPWSFQIVHQADAKVDIVNSDHHDITLDQQVGGVQFLSIAVVTDKPTVPKLVFRMNALDYENLQERLQTRIENKANIEIFKSITERFVEVFKEKLEQNPAVTVTDQEIDSCIGCMVTQAEVKLVRRCLAEAPAAAAPANDGQEGAGSDNSVCVNCSCRPMWCGNCMAKWFASRQDQARPETWLNSKCPCPTCRSKFCIMDVCPIDTRM